jgi:glycerate dehydrogenase
VLLVSTTDAGLTGRLGKSIAAVGRALGTNVLVAARTPSSNPSPAGDALPAPNAEDGRVPSDGVLRQTTVVVLSLP